MSAPGIIDTQGAPSARPGARPDAGNDWRPINTAPHTGERLRLTHEKNAADYEATGFWCRESSRWVMSNGFISSDRRMFFYPTHWKPLDRDRVTA